MNVAPIAERGLVRRALAGHAALGLLAAAILYVIALTGTLAVIHDRWQRWEQPGVPEFTSLSPAAAQRAVAAALARQAPPSAPLVTLQLPTASLPRASVGVGAVAWYVDREGRLTTPVSDRWTEFVVALHERLLLPASWGYALVGAVGVALGALALTGVLAHPRIARDAFRLRWRRGAHVARVDWHNRLGTWTLPFTLAIALTGAVLGLGTVGFAVLAGAYHGNDVARAYAPVFGAQPAPDATAAPPPDVAAALEALRTVAPQARPTVVSVPAPGTRGQEVQVLGTYPGRLIYGETYRFRLRGRPLGHAGLSDGALGQQAMASVYGLHFGDYGGSLVELAYLLFGAAMCAVTATGPSIWLSKRRRRGLDGPRLTACWTALVWGAPLLLVADLWLGLAAPIAAGSAWLFPSALVALIVTAATRPAWFATDRCRVVLLAQVAATGAVHVTVVRTGEISSIIVDVVLVFGSGLVVWAARASAARR